MKLPFFFHSIINKDKQEWILLAEQQDKEVKKLTNWSDTNKITLPTESPAKSQWN